MEIWKDVAGQDGRYQVSDQGRVRSLPHTSTHRGKGGRLITRAYGGMVLRPTRSNYRGMLGVTFGGQRTHHRIHVLVAAAFLGPRPAKADIAHINGDLTDNRAENLAYVSRSETVTAWLRSGPGRQALTSRVIQEIKDGLRAGRSGRRLAEELGVSEATVSRIKNGRLS